MNEKGEYVRGLKRDENGELIPKDKDDRTDEWTATDLQLGKCYKKDSEEHTFSFLLENVFKDGHPITLNHPDHRGGKILKKINYCIFQIRGTEIIAG